MRKFRKPALELLESRFNPALFAEPVTLSSMDGVLDIVLRAHESTQTIETPQPGHPELPGVATVVHGFMTYSWTLLHGTSSNGQSTGDTYPSPTLHVNRGEKLRILLENDLQNMQFVGLGGTKYDVSESTNIHFHGLTVSPKGNSDNVLLNVPPGMSNQYEVNIPSDHNEGVFWYHPHDHGLVSEQVYRGMAGMLVVGAANSNVYTVDASSSAKIQDLPVKLMTMQMQNIVEIAGEHYLDVFNKTNSTGYQYTINGQYNPHIVSTADNQIYIFLNASPMDLLRTFVPPPGQPESEWDYLGNRDPDRVSPANQEIFFVGQDGATFTETLGQERNAHAPGKRVLALISSPPEGESRTLALASLTPNFNGVVLNYHYLGRILGHGKGGTPSDWVNMALNSTTDPFISLKDAIPDVIRSVEFSTQRTPGKPSVFMVNGQPFPGPAVFQPRVGDLEEWEITNKDPIVHPIHIHLRDFQIIDGVEKEITPHNFDQDTFYVDAFNPDLPASQQHLTHLRIQFAPYLGTAVMHCHNLIHEDGGMMMLVKTIPSEEIVASSVVLGGRTLVRVMDRRDGTIIREFEPFAGFGGGANVALGDVDGDAIPDVAIGAMAGGGPRVRILSGKSGYMEDLYNGFVFDSGFMGGVSVALGDLDGDTRDDLIIGAGQGGGPRVRVLKVMENEQLASFYAYDQSFVGGVSVAAGLVDLSGRISVITGAGAGGGPNVRVFRDDLYKPFDTTVDPGMTSMSMPADPMFHNQLALKCVSSFFGLDRNFLGGITVSVGTLGAQAGGTSRIIVAAGPGGGSAISIWDATSTLSKPQAMSGQTTQMASTGHMENMGDLNFINIGNLSAYGKGYNGGVRAGATATPLGDLLLTTQLSGTKRVSRTINLIPDPTGTRLVVATNSASDFKADANLPASIAGFS